MIKINYTLLIVVLLVNTAIAQQFEIYNEDTINIIDSDGKKQGKWIYFNKDRSKIAQKGFYENHLRIGIWTSYYSSGNVKNEITFKNSVSDGFARAYHLNGNIAEEGYWRKNRWIGEYKSYYENGNLFYVWNYNNEGRRTGEQKYFYIDGSLAIIGKWQDGLKDGIISEYNMDGSKKREKLYELGKYSQTKIYNKKEKDEPNPIAIFKGTGFFKLYQNGRLSSEGDYEEGRLIDGQKFIYDAEGTILRTETYKKGIRLK